MTEALRLLDRVILSRCNTRQQKRDGAGSAAPPISRPKAIVARSDYQLASFSAVDEIL